MSQGFTSRGGRKRRAAGIKAKDVGHFVFRHAESGPSPQNVNRHFACENPAVIYTPDVGLELHVTASWAKIVAVTDSRTVTPLQQNLNKCSTCVPRHFNHNPPPTAPPSSFNQPTRELCQISQQADYISDYAQASGYISSNHICALV